MIDEKLVGEKFMLSQLQFVLTGRDSNELGFSLGVLYRELSLGRSVVA